MGCAGSKLDDLQAVALCRDRAARLDDAIRLRYALADAHVYYLKSLRSIGESLQLFFDSAAAAGAGAGAASPLLPLPQRRKLDPDPIPAAAAEATGALHARGHSHSGSHIEFLSESESVSTLSGDESPFHTDHRDFDPAGNDGYGRPQPETQYFYNYMRSQPPPAAVTYEQPPPASVYMSAPSTSSAPAYGYAYPYDYAPNFGGAGGGGYAGFFGSPPQGGYYASPLPPMPPAASGSRAAPPPPSPPRASTWDLLNPFETFERFYPAAPASASYTPSRDSREVREEEGIPELEEEEVVKEVSAVHDGSDGGYAASGPPPAVVVEDEAMVEDAVDKNVVGGGEPSVVEEHGSSVRAAYKAVRPTGTAYDVREIKLEFERAADSGRDVAKMLEAGKLPYYRRTAVHKASSKMRNAITPSLLATSTSTSLVDGKDGFLSDDILENKAMQAGNLSCTLEKLYIWERKLYAEVKAEEKLRVTLEQKCRRLKHLDERGAEYHKIDATRAYIHKLSTRIRIAIQVVESVSNTISKLRDEELWPEIRELIQGMVMMWRMMFECHKNQFLILSEGKNLDQIVSMGKLDEARMEATRRLEYDMLNWITSFHSWISLQKGYVKSINEWLLKCIDTNLEVTADGVAPFSPGRMGAPSVFVICHQWAQVMDRTSAHEVFEAMQSFAATVLQLLDQYNVEQRQRLMVNKDMDRRLKDLDGESQRLQKTIESVNKKLVVVSEESGTPLPGRNVHRMHDQNDRSLHLSLKHLFGAMEKFSADSMRAYEELRTRSGENG